MSDQILGRELMTADEVGILPNDECILRVRGIRPFKSKKFVLEKHPRHKQTADSGKTGLFDLDAYMSRRRAKMAAKAMEEAFKNQSRTFDDEADFDGKIEAVEKGTEVYKENM